MTDTKTNVESSLGKLEKIVSQFESGELGIEKGMLEYKKASKLIKIIRKSLEEKKLRIDEIKDSYTT